ncbi:MAG TPA: GNAT family N-acetyltransferase [Anaerolineae bacterium]|nr:GNAT family N-acetyltransferase [Anaerolineae bacterium]
MEVENLTENHIPRLHEIRADYISHTYVRVSRTDQGAEVGFLLRPERLTKPFRSQGLSIVGPRDRDEIRCRMGRQALQLVAEESGRLVALLDAQVESWRRVLKVWNLLVDEEHRRRGIGTKLMGSAEAFAIEKQCRAISIETQATNWPALSFYLKLGFEVCGVDDHFYTNRDLARKEVALFLYRELP